MLTRKKLVVCLQLSPRELSDRHGTVELLPLPLQEFVDQLWAGRGTINRPDLTVQRREMTLSERTPL